MFDDVEGQNPRNRTFVDDLDQSIDQPVKIRKIDRVAFKSPRLDVGQSVIVDIHAHISETAGGDGFAERTVPGPDVQYESTLRRILREEPYNVRIWRVLAKRKVVSRTHVALLEPVFGVLGANELCHLVAVG